MGRGGWIQPPSGMPQIPLPPNTYRVVTTTMDDRGVESLIAQRFTRAPFIMVIDIVDGRVVNVQAFSNQFANYPRGAGIMFSQWIASIGARAVLASNVGPNASYVLQQAGIAVHIVPPGTRIIDALRSLGIARM